VQNWEVVVAQLAERLPLTPEDLGKNADYLSSLQIKFAGIGKMKKAVVIAVGF